MKKEDSEYLTQAYIHVLKASNQVNQMPITNKVKRTRTELYLAEEALSKSIRTHTLNEEQRAEIAKYKEAK